MSAMPPPRPICGAVSAFVASSVDRPSATPGADEGGGEERREADRAEPAEEVGAPLDAAEAVALAGAHRVEGGGGENRFVPLEAVVDAVAVEVVDAGRRGAGREVAVAVRVAGGCAVEGGGAIVARGEVVLALGLLAIGLVVMDGPGAGGGRAADGDRVPAARVLVVVCPR